jgi:hypothetical protein
MIYPIDKKTSMRIYSVLTLAFYTLTTTEHTL